LIYYRVGIIETQRTPYPGKTALDLR